MKENRYLLRVENLKKHFPIYGGVFYRQVGRVLAVDGLSFAIRQGETLGLVGESGCGKTTVGQCIMRLHKPTEGRILFDDTDMATINRRTLRHLRKHIQVVFQDPFESLNPRHTVGHILEEPFKIHKMGNTAERRERVRELLDRVGLSRTAADRYPHEFSGGQRQRVGVARAMALNPRMIICDEPVSALDVSIQSQILNLLMDLQRESGFTYLFIAHDLAVVKHISDRIAVMYLGKIVETTDADTIYETPLHPYTKALISAIPVPDPTAPSKRQILQGDVPSPADPPTGCRFHTRCPYRVDKCTTREPALKDYADQPGHTHLVACHRTNELA
ncbi:MAG: dipeptide ABC transporter ATP-binding protein [Thermodesulfobacteriota bacterium]|nr:dipeptide ABC transporter ATP-binding protein [Thermodesulfobacteriota bacterium]